jgi:hypothetical protein
LLKLTSFVLCFRLIPATYSGRSEKVADILRNQWPTSPGISGRHAPELVDGMPRILQLIFCHYLSKELLLKPGLIVTEKILKTGCTITHYEVILTIKAIM